MRRISRRKWQESIRCLKTAIKNDKLPWAQRLRAVELLMCLYDCPLPESSRRTTKAVKAMVEERVLERSINNQVNAAVQQRSTQESETMEAEEQEQRVTRALSFLKEGPSAK